MKPAKAAPARRLLGWAMEMREDHPEEFRKVDRASAPSGETLESLGLKQKDALQVADAIRIGAQYFLTCDRRVRNKADEIKKRWQLVVLSPADFIATVAPPPNPPE